MLHLIYLITNKINGKLYIGQTKDIEKRWYSHCRSAKCQSKKDNMAFHKAIRKYGKENFSIQILVADVPKEIIDIKEIELIAQYNTTNRKIGYNLSSGGIGGKGLFGKLNGMFGKKRPDLVERNKLGKGKHLSEETRIKLGLAGKGRKHTEEYKKLMSKKLTGLKRSEETKRRISIAKKNISEETREKLRKPKSEEHKRKLSEARKGKKWNGTAFVLLNPRVL